MGAALRILFIGGTRAVGAHAAAQLHRSGAAVTLFHRGRTIGPATPPVERVCDPSAAYPVRAFPPTLTRRDWDAVVHMTPMGAADAEAAVAAFRSRAGRLVAISSGDAYRAYRRLTRAEPGPPDPTPLGEDAPLRARLFPYRGREAELGAFVRDYDKILVERAVLAAGDPPAVALRLPKLYGAEESADLASVYGFAARPGWRWTHGHVENVAAAVALAATHPAAIGGAFNLGEAETPTMAERLAALPPRPGPPPEPPPFDYSQDMALDTRRVRAVLGHVDVVDERAAMARLASEWAE